jgi:TPR repeat protein
MEYISLIAATTLTSWSERTFWRKLSEGSLIRSPGKGRAMVKFDDIKTHIHITLEPEDLATLELADEGNVAAQNEIAIIFLEQNKAKSAIYWLDLAVKKDDANAMYLLGRCYIDGNGLPINEDLGTMWIAKAASLKHALAQGIMQSMRKSYSNNT